MNKNELKQRLILLGINPNYYSLDGGLKPDSFILFSDYEKWNVFYLNERGGRDYEKEFNSEDEACSYIYLMFKNR